MQYSVHAPSQFIRLHKDRLLPTWSRPVSSVLVILQPANCKLGEQSSAAERQKQILRQKFLDLGYPIAHQLQQQGHLADLFDPRTGIPLLSQPGQLRLDDVAVAHACLGYPQMVSAGCSVLVHPTWGSAVYPSTLVSSANTKTVERVVQEVQRGSGRRRHLSECHQSLTGCGRLTEYRVITIGSDEPWPTISTL